MADLWIRSQDKHLLAKYNMLAVSQVTTKTQAYIMAFVSDDLGYEKLGTYKTKERALEVLDEIQNILTPRYIVTPESDTDLLEVFYDKKTANKYFYSDQVDIREAERNCIVFEMPKE